MFRRGRRRNHRRLITNCRSRSRVSRRRPRIAAKTLTEPAPPSQPSTTIGLAASIGERLIRVLPPAFLLLVDYELFVSRRDRVGLRPQRGDAQRAADKDCRALPDPAARPSLNSPKQTVTAKPSTSNQRSARGGASTSASPGSWTRFGDAATIWCCSSLPKQPAIVPDHSKSANAVRMNTRRNLLFMLVAGTLLLPRTSLAQQQVIKNDLSDWPFNAKKRPFSVNTNRSISPKAPRFRMD